MAFVTAVFTPPQNVSVTLQEFNLTTWTSVLSATTLTNSSVNTTILENIETQTGFTAFIPNDAALSGFDIGSLESNKTNLLTIVQNHVSGNHSLAHCMIERVVYARSSTTQRSTPRSCSTHPSTGHQLLVNHTHSCPTLVATLSPSELHLLGRTKQLLPRSSSLTSSCLMESCTS